MDIDLAKKVCSWYGFEYVVKTGTDQEILQVATILVCDGHRSLTTKPVPNSDSGWVGSISSFEELKELTKE
jgi:hypothetical protein